MTPTEPGQIAHVMQSLERRYVRHINDRHHRTGTVSRGVVPLPVTCIVALNTDHREAGMLLRHVARFAAAMALAGAMPCVLAQVVYTTTLSGVSAVPPNASPAVGSVTITYVPATSMMTVSMSFSGLSGIATAAHIHCCTPSTMNVGIATQPSGFTGFPTGVTSGSYQQAFDMTLTSSFNSAFVTASGGSVAAALQRLLEGLGNRTAYVDIHSAPYPGGEVRGNSFEQSIFRNGFD